MTEKMSSCGFVSQQQQVCQFFCFHKITTQPTNSSIAMLITRVMNETSSISSSIYTSFKLKCCYYDVTMLYKLQ